MTKHSRVKRSKTIRAESTPIGELIGDEVHEDHLLAAAEAALLKWYSVRPPAAAAHDAPPGVAPWTLLAQRKPLLRLEPVPTFLPELPAFATQ
jgi:hypothetical protein